MWMGYAEPSDPQMRRNVITTAKALMKKSGTMRTTKRVAYYTGMAPGLLLWNLKAIGLTERADMAFDGLFNQAMSPLGDFAEAYDGNDRWLNYAHMPNVYRPWETAINADAVLYYLTGYDYDHRNERLRLQPHLPPGTGRLTVRDLHAGPHTVTVTMNRSDDMSGPMIVTVENYGEDTFDLELILEPVQGQPAPQGFEPFEYADYQRTMWRARATLNPGDSIRGISK